MTRRQRPSLFSILSLVLYEEAILVSQRLPGWRRWSFNVLWRLELPQRENAHERIYIKCKPISTIPRFGLYTSTLEPLRNAGDKKKRKKDVRGNTVVKVSYYSEYLDQQKPQ